MHISSMLRMKWFKETYFTPPPPPPLGNNQKIILDVGSYCVGGGWTYREYFNDNQIFKYIGLDMVEGPNVDIAVKSPYKWNEISDNYCDAVISGQAFEHIEFPWLTMMEIARIVNVGGLICIIAPNGLGLHRYPVDCWRYYSDGMIAFAKYSGLEILHVSTNLAPKNASKEWYGNWQDCMLVARKTSEKIYPIDIDSYKCIPSNLEELNSGFIPMEEQGWYKNYLFRRKIKKVFKIILWPIVLIRRKILKRKNGA